MKLRLYHYWRSSSSWRVRWGLAIKGVACEFDTINLLSDETESPEQLARNPLGYVPVLEFLDRPDHKTSPLRYLTESMAILEWLEEEIPTPSLLPGGALQRARIRQLCEIINSAIQPLQNPNVAQLHSPDPTLQKEWSQHWVQRGLATYETWVKHTAGKFSVGDTLTLADLFLIPQCYNSLRLGVQLENYPTLHRIYKTAIATESCMASSPDRFKPSE